MDEETCLNDRIRRAVGVSRIVQMPFKRGDRSRETLLHTLGRQAGCEARTIGFVAFGGKTERYGLVQLERIEQKELL